MQVVLLRRCEDRAVEALSCSGQAVQRVRLDFGWEGALEGEGIEGVQMEWNALCYDITVSHPWTLNHHCCCCCALQLQHHSKCHGPYTASPAAFDLSALPHPHPRPAFAPLCHGTAVI